MGASLQPPQCSVSFHSSALQTVAKPGQGILTRRVSASACSSIVWLALSLPRWRIIGSFQVLATLQRTSISGCSIGRASAAVTSRKSSRRGPCVRRPSGPPAATRATRRPSTHPETYSETRWRPFQTPQSVSVRSVRILHQDADVLAVDKPAGVLTVPGRGANEPALSEQVRAIAPDALPVHRLDRDTSGVLLFAVTRA